jgi:hypothetical protein
MVVGHQDQMFKDAARFLQMEYRYIVLVMVGLYIVLCAERVNVTLLFWVAVRRMFLLKVVRLEE